MAHTAFDCCRPGLGGQGATAGRSRKRTMSDGGQARTRGGGSGGARTHARPRTCCADLLDGQAVCGQHLLHEPICPLGIIWRHGACSRFACHPSASCKRALLISHARARGTGRRTVRGPAGVRAPCLALRQPSHPSSVPCLPHTCRPSRDRKGLGSSEGRTSSLRLKSKKIQAETPVS